jgi:hypothetical protein
MGSKKGKAHRVYYGVEKGIPIPPKKLHHKELWASMEVGDSIVFPSVREWKPFQRQVGLFKERGKEFYHEDGATSKPNLRVWKVKEEE